jgi:hypothetical protein
MDHYAEAFSARPSECWRWAYQSVGGEFAVEVGRGHSAVQKEVATGDDCAVGAHEKRADGSDFVGSAAAPGGAKLDHASVPLTARAGQLIPGEGSEDDAGLIVLIRAPRLPHRTASAITRSEFPRLASW